MTPEERARKRREEWQAWTAKAGSVPWAAIEVQFADEIRAAIACRAPRPVIVIDRPAVFLHVWGDDGLSGRVTALGGFVATTERGCLTIFRGSAKTCECGTVDLVALGDPKLRERA